MDDGCPSEVDDIWKIEWPSTQRGATSTQLCPGGQDSIGIYNPLCIYVTLLMFINFKGNAIRACDIEGKWSDPDVLQCTSVEFINLENQVTSSQVILLCMHA